jgi:hypothetical protein
VTEIESIADSKTTRMLPMVIWERLSWKRSTMTGSVRSWEVAMIGNTLRLTLKKIISLIVPTSQPWMYGSVRDKEKDLAWTLEQNEKLRRALGAQGE